MARPVMHDDIDYAASTFEGGPIPDSKLKEMLYLNSNRQANGAGVYPFKGVTYVTTAGRNHVPQPVEVKPPPKEKKTKRPATEQPPAAMGDLVDAQWSVDGDGCLYANANNAYLLMATTPDIAKCFAFDMVANQAVLLHPLPNMRTPRASFRPRPMKDSDYAAAHRWLQQKPGWARMAKQAAYDAVDQLCEDAEYDPIRNYLENLPVADGLGLLDTWLFRFMGVGEGDPAYNRYVAAVGRAWLISAVARALQPGCQADFALILEGKQGRGKSSGLRALVPYADWFSDSLPDFHHKDASQHIEGNWIIEMAELTSVLKSDVEHMRRFLTRRVEKYRPSYGRKDIIVPRRCVFAGTTNRTDYLKDHQGERRLWPVAVTGPMDVEGIAAHRDQIWAEALAAYRSGESWWIDDPAVEDYATHLQKQRVGRDAWEDMLIGPLQTHLQVSMLECWQILGMEPKSIGTRERNRMKLVLDRLGFEATDHVFQAGSRRNSRIYMRVRTPS